MLQFPKRRRPVSFRRTQGMSIIPRERVAAGRHFVLGFSHSPEVLHKACRWSFWNPGLPSVQFHLLYPPELEPPREDNNNWKQPVCDCQFKDTVQKIMLSKFKRKTIPERNLSINTSITAELAKYIVHERLQMKSRFSSLDAGVPSSVREPENVPEGWSLRFQLNRLQPITGNPVMFIEGLFSSSVLPRISFSFSLSLPTSSLICLPLIYILSFYSHAAKRLAAYYPQYTLLQFSFLFLVSLLTESCSFQFCYNAPEFCKLYHQFTAKNDMPVAALFGQLFWILNTVSVSVSTAFAQGDGVSLWCWWNSSSRSGVCRQMSQGKKAFWGTLDGVALCSLRL